MAEWNATLNKELSNGWPIVKSAIMNKGKKQMSEIPMQHHYNIIAFTAPQNVDPDINVRMTELLELKYCLLQETHHSSDAFNCPQG